MKVIGITGGVGAGKSEVLRLIEEMTDCIIIKADDLARSLERRGEVCYEPLVELLGPEILGDEGEIDSGKMAGVIFARGKDETLQRVNAIVHPAVKVRILELIEKAKREDRVSYFFIEAALLIEDHYDLIVDEMWYVRADEEVRRLRLKTTRSYSDEKIDQIMKNQSPEEVFINACSVVIDNNTSIEDVKHRLKELLTIG